MYRKITLIVVRGALAMVMVMTAGAGTAMAATVPSADVGSGLGNLLSNLGGELLIPIAGLFGLAAFVRRDVGHAVTIFVIAAIVGVFVYDPGGAKSLISTIASSITSGK